MPVLQGDLFPPIDQQGQEQREPPVFEGWGFATTDPTKAFIKNLRDGEEREFPLNPETFEHSIEAYYNKDDIMGMSHQPLTFSHTGNHEIPIQLYVDQFFTAIERQRGLADAVGEVKDFRKFLLSFMAVSNAGAGVIGGAPDSLLFVWPGLFGMECVMRGLHFEYKRFTGTLDLWAYTAKFTLESVRDSRMYAEDLRANGTEWG